MSVRAAVLAIIVATGVTASACSGKKERQRRTGSAAPVEVIARPAASDAGAVVGADEVEPNDGADVATLLAPGSTVRAQLDSETDVDYFRVDVTEAGALAVTTSAVDADLVLELEDATGTVVARSDRGGARVREGVPNFGVTPGRYAVVVRKKQPPPPKRPPRGKKAPAAPAKPFTPVAYEVTAQVGPPARGAELEPNDDRGTANDLIAGEPVTGFLGWSGDADVWKLSIEALSASNAIDVEVGAIEGVALALELADGVGQVMAARKAPRGKPLAIRGLVPSVPPGGSPFHYVTVRGDRSNPETGYSLRVTAKEPGPDAEAEPNDTVARAMAIPADRTVVHATWTTGDVDCFAVAADVAARTVEATVEVPGELDLAAELYVDGASAAKANAGGKGKAERVAAAVPPNARAVVCVRGVGDAAGEGAYDVKITEGPAAP